MNLNKNAYLPNIKSEKEVMAFTFFTLSAFYAFLSYINLHACFKLYQPDGYLVLKEPVILPYIRGNLFIYFFLFIFIFYFFCVFFFFAVFFFSKLPKKSNKKRQCCSCLLYSTAIQIECYPYAHTNIFCNNFAITWHECMSGKI